MGRILPPANEVPPALAAFLRGSERRAWVFLWLQAGDADAADQALAATVRAFRVEAAQLPMAEWPGRYWRLLAACPLDAQGGQWPPGLDLLATPAPADRRALLLRLAGGLDEQPAAEAMGVALGVYRERLAAACPRDATGQVDVAAWHGLAQAIQQAARDLPESRLERIAALRETALAGHGTPEAPSTRAHAVGKGPGRGRRTLWVALLLLAVAALAGAGAWWWWQQRSAALPISPPADDVAGADDLRVHDRGPILVEPLPDPAPPAVPADPVPPALDEPPLDPVVAAVDFLSWYAAGAPASRMESEAGDAAEPLVPPPEEDAGRLAEQAWAELDAGDRAILREAFARYSALPVAEQEQLRRRFATLDRMERRGWLLGPAVGDDWPRLQPWLGYVPEAERSRLLAILRAMEAGQRRQLAEVLRRQSPVGRVELRQELLALPAARRADWLDEVAAVR